MALVVIEVTLAPPMLRGCLQRRMLEVRSGLFVADLPARIRDELWVEIQTSMHFGDAIMVMGHAKKESSFVVRTHGKNRREPVILDGCTLVRYVKHWGEDETVESALSESCKKG